MTYFATSSEMEKLDNIAVENGLEIRQMMELAGWHILRVFSELEIEKNKKVLIVCGKGNKGGDGLSAARHLKNNGWKVSVILLSKELAVNPKHHLRLLKKMDLKIILFEDSKMESEKYINDADVIIDALIGYHLKGAPREDYAKIIKLINASGKKVIAYDLPTGVDATTGECYEPSIHAEATLTLALPKAAFEKEKTRNYSGKIFLADIGIPAKLYDEISPGSRPEFKIDKLLKL